MMFVAFYSIALALEVLSTGLLQSPSFRFSVGGKQYKQRVFLKTEYLKLYTAGLFSKVLLDVSPSQEILGRRTVKQSPPLVLRRNGFTF
jgi:hypothetical protein